MPTPDEIEGAATFHAQDLARMRPARKRRRPRGGTGEDVAAGVAAAGGTIGAVYDGTGQAGRRDSLARRIVRRILGDSPPPGT
jgi:hypothetical protein